MPDRLPVALAVMTAGELRMECAEGILDAVYTGAVSRTFFTQSGPYLDNGRNNTVRVFMDPVVRDACTHLLMVDSDIGFRGTDVRALYEAAQERAVVGGVYYSAFDAVAKPIVYDWAKVEDDNGTVLDTLEVIDKWGDGWTFWNQREEGDRTQNPLVRVRAMGAGFLMIRYEVLDVLLATKGEPQPWFDEPVIDGVHFGEDLAFCMSVEDAGFGVWAHRGVEVAHYKNTTIGTIPGSRIEDK